MKVKVVNLTPHPLNIITPEKEIKIFPEGVSVRLTPQATVVGKLNIEGVEVPLERVEYGGPVFLKDGEVIPPQEVRKIVRQGLGSGDQVVVAVPQLLANKAQYLKELFAPALIVAPNTNKAVRDEQGRILGVKGLILLA